MAEIGAPNRRGAGVRGITGYQWLVLFVAWAGWSLDITDFTLYGLVLRQAMTDLLGGNPTLAQIGSVGGLITTVGLLGWAVGGFFFGIIADYLGRVRTLALSILIYSVFTALQGLAQDPWQLGVFRFIAGLGTGAELMIAIPLVAEAFAETYRAKILGFMMTGGGFGTLFGAVIYGWVGPYGWRYVFFVGIAPALLLAFIRRGMVEPERFAAVKAGGRHLRRAASTPKRTANSCAWCRRNCSAARSAIRRWSASCSHSAPCWRCGPPRPGCRRSRTCSWKSKASPVTPLSHMSEMA